MLSVAVTWLLFSFGPLIWHNYNPLIEGKLWIRILRHNDHGILDPGLVVSASNPRRQSKTDL